VVFSSDLGRCLETTKILFPQRIPEIISDFREMNFGKWEGKTYIELANDPLYEKWINDFYMFQPPEGESFKDFSQRVTRGWIKVKTRLDELQKSRATIVTHGGVVKYLLSQFAPDTKDFWEWKVPHGGGYELLWPKEAWKGGERCTLLREVPLMGKQHGSESIMN
jgi:alpha-ribazole phosphatase